MLTTTESIKSAGILNDAIDNPSEIHEGQLSKEYGFVPFKPIPENFPKDYQVWDKLAKELPELVKGKNIRQALQKLDAEKIIFDADKLEEKYLARAAVLLSCLAHAYYFNEDSIPLSQRESQDALPNCIKKPWETVIRRIGRGGENAKPLRTNFDNFMCNWRKINPKVIVPQNLADIELLIPVFKDQEERIFNTTIVLMELKFAPAISGMIAALEAVAKKNETDLISALKTITEAIEAVTETFKRINPNPYNKYHVDPVVWAKTVGRFDQNIFPNSPGVTGASSPLFHALDAFIERKAYQVELGKLIESKQQWMPKQHLAFIKAIITDVTQYSIANFVENSGNTSLKNTYAAMMNAYTGKNGLLKVHRLKAVGYVELNYAAGRLETTGGHKAKLEQDTPGHIRLHDNLTASSKERRPKLLVRPTAKIEHKQELGDNSNLYKIVLDLSESGISFKAGDRCRVFPQNSAEKVDEVIKNLKLNGNELITLNAKWLKYCQKQGIKDGAITLKTLLSHAQLYPVDEQTLKSLNSDNFCEILKPLKSRLYSISHSYDTQKNEINKDKIRLTIRRDSKGVASNYLCSTQQNELRFQKDTASDFHLPENKDTPILMFAMGSGIAPFPGFIANRLASENWLFWAIKNEDSFNKDAELQVLAIKANVNLRVFCSDNAKLIALGSEQEKFKVRQVEKNLDREKRWADIIRADAERIKKLVNENKAKIYICGNSDFASTIEKMLIDILAIKKADFHKMTANHHFNLDTFTSASTKKEQKNYMLSEIAKHNKPEDCLIVIDKKVYNLTDFLARHPGGDKLIYRYAGRDASNTFNAIGHGSPQQIAAQLEDYKVGVVQQPKLPEDFRKIYDHGCKVLHLILEIENDLVNNTQRRKQPLTASYLTGDIYQNFFSGSFSELNNNLFYLRNLAGENSSSKTIEKNDFIGKKIQLIINNDSKDSTEIFDKTTLLIDKIKSALINFVVEFETGGNAINITSLYKHINTCQVNIDKYLKYLQSQIKELGTDCADTEIPEQATSGPTSENQPTGGCPFGYSNSLKNSESKTAELGTDCPGTDISEQATSGPTSENQRKGVCPEGYVNNSLFKCGKNNTTGLVQKTEEQNINLTVTPNFRKN